MGAVLLASGRYTENAVDVNELLGQGQQLHGFWVGLTQLPRSHPFTVRRLERLYGLGLFEPVVPTTVNANAVRSPKVAGA
jgi:hypothetical protein